MTISADILSRSPVLYWKLDEATGPAASDSSGHGHPGAYGGSFTLHQYGPEPGTFAAQFAQGGFVTCTGFPQIGSAPFSVLWYCARQTQPTPSGGDEWIMGNRNFTRGYFFHVFSGDTCRTELYQATGTLNSGSAFTIPTWNRWWHAYALVWNGSTTMTMWVDGSQVVTHTTSNLSTVQSADTFGLNATYPMVVAHLAYYDKALISTDIAAIHSYRYDWPFAPMVNTIWPAPPAGSTGLNPSDPVVVDINADLSDIHRAVIHDYTTGPPP